MPKGARRAAGKARRIDALLDAARELIEEIGGTDFTMLELARRAGFSLATTYNLIGTKAAVLYALLNRSLDDLDLARADLAAKDFDFRIASMVELAVGFFDRKPFLYRPLMRYLLGAYEPVLRPRFMNRALTFWRSAAEVRGSTMNVGERPSHEELAWHLHLAFTGILDLWVHEELTGLAFREAMLSHARLLTGAFDPAIR